MHLYFFLYRGKFASFIRKPHWCHFLLLRVFFCTCDSFSHVFPCVFYISTFSSLPKIILLHFQCYTFCSEQIVTDLTRKQVSWSEECVLFFCFLVFCCCCWVMIYWKSAWTFVFIRDNIIRIKHVTASVMQTFLHIHVLGCISDVHFRLLSNTEEDEGSRVVCERSLQTSYRAFRNDPDLW